MNADRQRFLTYYVKINILLKKNTFSENDDNDDTGRGSPVRNMMADHPLVPEFSKNGLFDNMAYAYWIMLDTVILGTIRLWPSGHVMNFKVSKLEQLWINNYTDVNSEPCPKFHLAVLNWFVKYLNYQENQWKLVYVKKISEIRIFLSRIDTLHLTTFDRYRWLLVIN